MEEMIQTKLTNGIQKHGRRHLSLAARIVVANSLILSTIWYLITLWAGDLSFLSKIQGQITKFVWAGKSRVDKLTITQRKSKRVLV